MAVMVTGTGFIGGYVVRDLLAAGADVVLFGLFGGPGDIEGVPPPDLVFADKLIGGGLLERVRVIVGDITDPEAILRAVSENRVSSIIHLASMVTSAAAANPLRSIRVNAEGTGNLFEAATKVGVEKVVWASSIGIFGPRSLVNGTISDDSPIDPRTLYGATKVVSEQLARIYADKGLDVTGIRPGRVYGYGEHVKSGRGSGSSWLMRLLHEPVVNPGNILIPFGELCVDFHYVEDVASTFVKALQSRGNSGEAYVTHGDYRSMRDAFKLVSDALPDAGLRLVDGPADVPKGYSTIWSYRFDASRAEAELGIRNRFSMEAGIMRTLNLYRADLGLPPLPEHAA